MQYEFITTAEDYFAFNLHKLSEIPSIAKQISRTRLIGVVFGALFTFFLFLITPEFSWLETFAFPLVFAVAIWFLAPRYLRWQIKRNMRRLAADGSAGPEGDTRLTVNADGLSEEIDGITTSFGWNKVERIEETPEHAFVLVGPLQAFIIPKREPDGINAIAEIRNRING